MAGFVYLFQPNESKWFSHRTRECAVWLCDPPAVRADNMDMMMDDERPAVIKHYEPTYIMQPAEDKKYVLNVAAAAALCHVHSNVDARIDTSTRQIPPFCSAQGL